MNAALQKLVEAHCESGKKNYARWDDRLYQQICAGPATFLWDKTAGDSAVAEGYLTAICEGIGRGYVTQSADPKFHEFFVKHIKWRSLLEYWLVLALPLGLPSLKPDLRVPFLGKFWNLGENILRDKAWVDPYLLKRSVESQLPILEIEKQLAEWMSPLLQAPTVSRWQPPFEVRVIDGRTIRDDFIPGEMHFSAPFVACVRDRRLQDSFGGIFLHELGGPVISHHNDLGQHKSEPPNVSVESDGSSATINGHTVPLPHIGRVHSKLLFAGGIILLTAVDSQKIWLIQCQ